MAKFLIKNETTSETLNLDTNVVSIDISGISRNYELVNLFADGADVRGFGFLDSRTFSFRKKHRIESGTASGTAWNDTRDTINKWIATPESNELNLYVENTDGTETYKTRIWPISSGNETWDNLKITNQIDYTFALVTGVFENDTATQETDTISDTGLHVMNFTVTGNREVPPIIKFTPSADFTLFQVQLNSDYGFRLESNFNSGDQIVYNCSTGVVTVAGLEVPNIQTAGSVFTLTPGSVTLNIYATSCAADAFIVEYNERIV